VRRADSVARFPGYGEALCRSSGYATFDRSIMMKPQQTHLFLALELALLEAEQALEHPLTGVLAAPDIPLGPRVKARLSWLAGIARISLAGVAFRCGLSSSRYDELDRAWRRLNVALHAFDPWVNDQEVADATREAKRFAAALEDAARKRQARHRAEDPHQAGGRRR
jgi:hypothetical protein